MNDWREPIERYYNEPEEGCRVIVERQQLIGWSHVVTPDHCRSVYHRLAKDLNGMPPVNIVLTAMTRKKAACNIYGLQWDHNVYLYPLRSDLTEHIGVKSRPHADQFQRACGMVELDADTWQWPSIEAARTFALESVLVHELGHVVDSRNGGVEDRERFAVGFEQQYGRRLSNPGKTWKNRVNQRHRRSFQAMYEG